MVSTPHGRAVPLERRGSDWAGAGFWFQPLMGEPSLWNTVCNCISRATRVFVSTPHGRAVPLELQEDVMGLTPQETFQPLMGEPSLWNTRPARGEDAANQVSTPHGRAVPLERASMMSVVTLSICFNPSWESRPSGTPATIAGSTSMRTCFNPSWESRPSGTIRPDSDLDCHRFVSTPHGRAVPLEPA